MPMCSPETLTFAVCMWGAALLCFRSPSDPKQSAVNAICLTARPLAHKNRIDCGAFFTSWARSRNESATPEP